MPPPRKLEALDRLPLWCAIRLLFHLGIAEVGGTNTPINDLRIDPQRILAQGYAVILDGFHGVLRLFDRLRQGNATRAVEWIPRAQYGQLYSWLMHNTRNIAELDELRQLVYQHTRLPSIRTI